MDQYSARNPAMRDNRLASYAAGHSQLREHMLAFRSVTNVDALDAIIAATVSMGSLISVDGGGEDARRPLPVSAVARSLCLPRESVRRRAQRLAEAGWLTFGPEGLIGAALLGDAISHRAFIDKVKASSLALLQALGYQANPDREPRRAWLDMDAVDRDDRLFARLGLLLSLRLYESARLLDPALDKSLVLTTVLSLTFAGARLEADEANIDEARLAPVISRLSLAKLILVNPETLRRLLARLKAEDLLTVDLGGIAPTHRLLLSPALRQSVDDAVVGLRGHVRLLARAGFINEPHPQAGA